MADETAQVEEAAVDGDRATRKTTGSALRWVSWRRGGLGELHQATQSRAGLELRLKLVERDDHDQVLAEWERTLDDAARQRLRSQGYRLVSDAA